VRVTLFDWVGGGHHPIYVRRFAEALRPAAEVVVAAPDETIGFLDGLTVRTISLGAPRPVPPQNRLYSDARRVFRDEVALLERVGEESRPDHLFHMYADPVLPLLLRRLRLHPPITAMLFYPRAHYPDAFGTQLSLRERGRANAKDLVVAAWRHRPDAHALLTLDEEAARRWQTRGGAPAYWIPEPPVPISKGRPPENERRGCILYGALAERKGIDLLARAVALGPSELDITIAGEVGRTFLPRLTELVAEMRESGATVDLQTRRLSEAEGLDAMARARCAVLPYPAHDGMSRVLVEAATVATPVIVHDRGLLGHLVRRHRLGLAVDCRDAATFRRALLELSAEGDTAEAYRESLLRFASRFSPERFERAAIAPFDGASRSNRDESKRFTASA
jgi:glycosyltransferase involved in cell wall biosynthesis